MLAVLAAALLLAADPTPSRIELNGDVTDESMSALLTQIQTRANGGATDLDVFVDSPGGGVFALMHFLSEMDELRRLHPDLRLHCRAGALVASAAAVLWMDQCDTREVSTVTVMVFHNARSMASGTAEQIEEQVKVLRVLDLVMAVRVARRLKITLEQYEARIRHGDWILGPTDAVEVGAADRISGLSGSAQASSGTPPG